MSIVPKKDYIVLLIGDLVLFIVSLWVTLAARYLEIPSFEQFYLHLVPFSLLFAAWVMVFFLAGLYERHTRLFRDQLPAVIFYAQTVNVVLAALFFFFIPYFGIAPKTILAIYLVVSSLLIFVWRVYIFARLRPLRKMNIILIGHGSVVEELRDEIDRDPRYPFACEQVIDTGQQTQPEVIQQLCRIAAGNSSASVIIADTTDDAMTAVLPIIYDAAFRDKRFVFVDLNDFYQGVFDRVPLGLVRYDWVLSTVGRSILYARFKRIIDIVLGAFGTAITFTVLYPIIGLAVKLEDGGDIFITQERVGQYHAPIHLLKFRSMSGNDEGNYEGGKTKLVVTRVGHVLRKLHLDEFPQFWNLLKGDVSFVGPRPEFPSLVAQYSARIPYYNARHLVAPGLTGWARLHHRNAPHHGTDMEETKFKLSYDLYYLRHRSLLLDVHIMLQTIKLVLTARGA